MKQIILSFYIIFLPVLSASGKKNNTFSTGIFQYKVMGYADNYEAPGRGVCITGVNRSVTTGPFFNKEIIIPTTVVHNGYKYNVEGIEDYAFVQCDEIERIVISDGIQFVRNSFTDCHNLQSVFISKTVLSIDNPFSDCPNLKEIVVDEENPIYDSRENCNAIIRKRDNSLVCGCYTTIIPRSVERIEDYAFYKCRKLEHVTLPEGIVELGDGVFSGCINLQSIQLPHSLKAIRGGALFSNCPRLKAVHIPENLSVIEDYCLFNGCFSLDSITVDCKNKVFDSRQGCNAIIRTANDELIAGCGQTVIPDGVKGIGDAAFYDTILREIRIPASVTHITPGAFRGTKYCTSISVDEKNPVYDSRNGCNAIIETATDKIVAGCISTIMPESIKSIGEYSFSDMRLPSVVVIPEGVRTIEISAFSRSEFDKVVIPSSVDDIEYCAFNRSTLNQVYWKGHVDTIPWYAFAGCYNLRVMYIPEGTKVIDQFAFESCKNLSAVSLPTSLEKIEYNAFQDTPCEKLVKESKADIIHEPEITCPVCRSYFQDN